MQIEKHMLQAEIEFWRFMIESRRGTVSEQATERMQNACELAERKLTLMGGGISATETRQ
jgi:hypothetical protein